MGNKVFINNNYGIKFNLNFQMLLSH